MHAWPVIVGQFIHYPLLVGASVPAGASIGAIKPDLKEFPIIGHQLGELVPHVGDVFWFAVVGVVAVPGGIVNSYFQPIFSTGIHKFSDQVSFSISPRAVFDRVLRVGRWPKHKAIVVFGRDDEAFHACFFGHTRPLPCIQSARGKLARLLVSKAPLPIREGVHVEMHKAIVLQVLPGDLSRLRNRVYWSGRSSLCKSQDRKKK